MAAKVDAEKCVGCANCEDVCPVEAIKVKDGIASINEEECIECGACVSECPMDAISL